MWQSLNGCGSCEGLTDSLFRCIRLLKVAVMVFTSSRAVPQVIISLHGEAIRQVLTHKHIALTLDSHLSWSFHVEVIISKVSWKRGLLCCLRHTLPSLAMLSLFTVCIRPTVEYASVAWCGIRSGDSQRLECVQRSAARLIAGVSVWDRLPHEILLACAGLDHLSLRRRTACAEFAFHLLHSSPDKPLIPSHLVSAYLSWKALSLPLQALQSFGPLPLVLSGFHDLAPRFCVSHPFITVSSSSMIFLLLKQPLILDSLLSFFICLISVSLCQ